MASQVQLRHATRRLLRAASHLNRPTNAHAAALLPLATSPQAPAAALPQGAVGSAGLLSSVTAAVRAASGAARLDKGVKRERLTSALEAQRRLLDDLANPTARRCRWRASRAHSGVVNHDPQSHEEALLALNTFHGLRIKEAMRENHAAGFPPQDFSPSPPPRGVSPPSERVLAANADNARKQAAAAREAKDWRRAELMVALWSAVDEEASRRAEREVLEALEESVRSRQSGDMEGHEAALQRAYNATLAPDVVIAPSKLVRVVSALAAHPRTFEMALSALWNYEARMPHLAPRSMRLYDARTTPAGVNGLEAVADALVCGAMDAARDAARTSRAAAAAHATRAIEIAHAMGEVGAYVSPATLDAAGDLACRLSAPVHEQLARAIERLDAAKLVLSAPRAEAVAAAMPAGAAHLLAEAAGQATPPSPGMPQAQPMWSRQPERTFSPADSARAFKPSDSPAPTTA